MRNGRGDVEIDLLTTGKQPQLSYKINWRSQLHKNTVPQEHGKCVQKLGNWISMKSPQDECAAKERTVRRLGLNLWRDGEETDRGVRGERERGGKRGTSRNREHEPNPSRNREHEPKWRTRAETENTRRN